MKLNRLFIFACVFATLLAAMPAIAQEDAAASPRGDAVDDAPPEGTLAEKPGLNTEEAEEGEAGAAAVVDAAAERAAMVEAIQGEMDLPHQADTGVMAPNFWMPIAASEQAAGIDRLFWFVMWVTIFFTVLITGAMIWFCIRYRHREGDPDPEGAPTHSTTLEITWTVIPTCIVLVMFVMGFKGYLETTVPPQNPYTVRVTGAMWNWTFTYENGAITNDLHLPKDRPVQFLLQSQDVLHSLYIPAFRLKKDVVPGRTNSFWVTPNRAGIYEVFCAEYCGTNHSLMGALCFVYEEDRYDEMLAQISNIYRVFPSGEERAPDEVGRLLHQQRGCSGCHSINGTIIQAPSWQGLWMSQRPMTDGSTVLADENYIRESIFYPQEHIVTGFGNAMPSALGQLSNDDINSIIAFMKTLSDNAKETADGELITPDESTSLSEDAETGND